MCLSFRRNTNKMESEHINIRINNSIDNYLCDLWLAIPIVIGFMKKKHKHSNVLM